MRQQDLLTKDLVGCVCMGGGGRGRNQVLARKIIFVYSGQYYLFSPSSDYTNLLIMIVFAYPGLCFNIGTLSLTCTTARS